MQAFDELSRFAWSMDELLHYDSYDMKHSDNKAMYEHAWDEGIQEGLAKGRLEGEVRGLRKGRTEGRKEGKKEGKEAGKKEGKKEGRAEIVKNMLALGMTLDTIVAATGLTIEEIKGCARVSMSPS